MVASSSLGLIPRRDLLWEDVRRHAVSLLRSPPPRSILKGVGESGVQGRGKKRGGAGWRGGGGAGGRRDEGRHKGRARVAFADEDSVYSFSTENASSHGSRPWGYGYERDESSLTDSEVRRAGVEGV